MNIKTRFAPSPTGPLHMGNARTALFNYLFAKKEGGTFLLRIEDTDKERSEKKWEQDVLENLAWLGLHHDQEFVRQSERTEIYKEYLQKLLNENRAYWCFCEPEELQAQHQDQLSRGEAPHYTGTCRQLSKQKQQERLEAKERAVIRFAVEPKKITFRDLIRGEVTFDMSLAGDIVIAKDLKTPLYNFTVVIDDHLQKITHIIRGEDHISNTPKQQLLQEALGIPKTIKYAHLPLLLGQDRTKLSKRHGDMSATRFREEGYLPEAVINFLVLLGWNPGDEREIFSLQQLEKEFSLEKVQKAGAVFSTQRLDWINGFYIRKKSLGELATLVIPHLQKAGLLKKEGGADLDFLSQVVSLYQERLKKLSEIAELANFFFQKDLSYEKELLSWKGMKDKEVTESLKQAQELLSGIEQGEWTKENLEARLAVKTEAQGDRGRLLWPLRAALTGKKASAGPFEIAAVLGKEKTLQRITDAKTKLQ